MADRRLLHGWGRTAPTAADVVRPAGAAQVAELIAARPARGLLARGAGRSYGDAAQNAGGIVVDTGELADIREPGAAGEIECGAGATLDAVLQRIVPAGWFLPVTPGTRHVTVGGALAFDVHGKNHPVAGTFARHAASIDLVDGLGVARSAVPGDPLFDATAGGLGLTGIVTRIRLRTRAMASATMLVDTQRTGSLEHTVEALESSTREYRVAWLDTLRGARGVVTLADHAPVGDPLSWDAPHTRTVPGVARAWASRVLTPRRIAAFNSLYFHRAPRDRTGEPVPLADFHYPLDAVADWNLLYGPRGFVQYQLACPEVSGIAAVLTVLRAERSPAFLAVLKRFGGPAPGPLSFPIAGYTLALDLPAAPALGPLLDRLDHLVADHGGRVYLAKDARMRPRLLAKMYPRLDEWQEIRAVADPHRVFRSDLTRRLGL